jgi:hypothetical protein
MWWSGGGIRGPMKVREREILSQLAAVFPENFFHNVNHIRGRTVERSANDADGTVG